MHGLEVLKDARPDVIITDINMPRMDGLVSSKARGDDLHRAVPILVLTTKATQ